MAEGFYVTNKGIELINAVIPNDGKVEINKAKFGSGGTEGAWNYDISAMESEEYSKNLDPETDKYKVSDTDPKALFLSVVVPAEVSCRINEVGFFDNNDNLIIYGIVRDQTKVQGVKYQYDCWVKFDNVDSANVEIKIISSEYEKVEKLVQDTKQEFNQKIESLESEFDISGYVTQEQWGTLGTTYSTIEKVNAVEKKIDDFTSGSEGGLSEYLKKSEASSTYLNKQVASQTYVAKKEGYDLVSSENVAQITTNKTNIDKKVDKEEGSSLIPSVKLALIDTNASGISTNKSNIESIQTKLTTFATQQSLDEVIALVNKIGTFKGVTTKSELTTIKSTANVGDTYIISDDSDHWYEFCGIESASKNNINADGFYDMGNHIDLSGLVSKEEGKSLISNTDIAQITTNKTDIATLKTSKADTTALNGYVQKVEGSSLITDTLKTQITTNQTNITSLQSGKVDKVSGKDLVASTDIAQITTNKTNIESIQSDLSELATFLNTYA